MVLQGTGGGPVWVGERYRVGMFDEGMEGGRDQEEKQSLVVLDDLVGGPVDMNRVLELRVRVMSKLTGRVSHKSSVEWSNPIDLVRWFTIDFVGG